MTKIELCIQQVHLIVNVVGHSSFNSLHANIHILQKTLEFLETEKEYLQDSANQKLWPMSFGRDMYSWVPCRVGLLNI